MNNLEYIKEVKNSQYISSVDKFLYDANTLSNC